MPKLPAIKPKQIKKVLIKLKFTARPGKGSHTVFKYTDGRRTVISTHNKPVSIGVLKAILRQIKISTEEFLELL